MPFYVKGQQKTYQLFFFLNFQSHRQADNYANDVTKAASNETSHEGCK